MKIKFKYLKIYYFFGAIVGPICALAVFFQPNFGNHSESILKLCFVSIVILGLSGGLLSLLTKLKFVEIVYSENDKDPIFYKLQKNIRNK